MTYSGLKVTFDVRKPAVPTKILIASQMDHRK
jgi:hypothetical protein